MTSKLETPSLSDCHEKTACWWWRKLDVRLTEVYQKSPAPSRKTLWTVIVVWKLLCWLWWVVVLERETRSLPHWEVSASPRNKAPATSSTWHHDQKRRTWSIRKAKLEKGLEARMRVLRTWARALESFALLPIPAVDLLVYSPTCLRASKEENRHLWDWNPRGETPSA